MLWVILCYLTGKKGKEIKTRNLNKVCKVNKNFCAMRKVYFVFNFLSIMLVWSMLSYVSAMMSLGYSASSLSFICDLCKSTGVLDS